MTNRIAARMHILHTERLLRAETISGCWESR